MSMEWVAKVTKALRAAEDSLFISAAAAQTKLYRNEAEQAAARLEDSLAPQKGWKKHLRRAQEVFTGPSDHPDNLFIDALPGSHADRFGTKVTAHVERVINDKGSNVRS